MGKKGESAGVRLQGHSWRELCKAVLTKSEQGRMRASFDTIGDIAIVEMARGLAKKEKRLAKLLLDSQPGIRVVAKKLGAHVGRFRHQPLKVIAGERRNGTKRHVRTDHGPLRLETVHRESGCCFSLNVRTCYFSPRMGTERLRIARLVRPGENVLVLFAGIAPFSIVIAKHAEPKHVDSVELNPDAHQYALENVRLNKVDGVVTPIRADAAKFLKACPRKYDRILLAWPGHADSYVDAALRCLKKGGTVHFYDFQARGEFVLAANKVIDACKKLKRKCVVKGIAVCGQHKPHVNRVCVDAVAR